MALRINDLVGRKVLVLRESARPLAPALLTAIDEGNGKIELDFSGIEGITPSFLDELLGIISEQLTKRESVEIVISHPPTTLSEKFSAVGRSYGLTIRETVGGDWTILTQS
jgi:hypothetical protein